MCRKETTLQQKAGGGGRTQASPVDFVGWQGWVAFTSSTNAPEWLRSGWVSPGLLLQPPGCPTCCSAGIFGFTWDSSGYAEEICQDSAQTFLEDVPPFFFFNLFKAKHSES